MAGIYLHIPFCKQACTYCDFYFETSQKHRAGFTNRLLREIDAASDSFFSDTRFETIYIGGGTPSRLSSEEVSSILKRLHDRFTVDTNAEITMEVNPDDITQEKLQSWKDAGVNRLSIGIQTFDENRLKFMNRAHTPDEARNALRMISEAGFKSLTADLIYGNPGQTAESVRKDIAELMRFDPPHISAYTLTVEPNTRLGSMVRKNLVQPAEDDEVALQMDVVVEELRRHGIERYEVSNFAKPGHESKHNGAYWYHKNYLGLGPSAHSFWWDYDREKACRWFTKPSLKKYMETDPLPLVKSLSEFVESGEKWELAEAEWLNLNQLGEERLLTGMRTREGVKEAELNSRYDYELSQNQIKFIDHLRQKGLMFPDDPLRFTSEGMKIADYLILDIITKRPS